MIITKQDFEKLSKVKQIEYKSKIDKIRNEDFHSYGLIYVWWFIYGFAFFLVILPLYKIAFGAEILISFFNTFSSYLLVSKWIIILGFSIDLVRILNYIRRLDSVKREYFKHKIEVINGR